MWDSSVGGLSPHSLHTCLTSACRCRSCTHCSRCLRCCSAARSSSCCFSCRNSSRSCTRVAMSTSRSHSSSTPVISPLLINDQQVFQRQIAPFHILLLQLLLKVHLDPLIIYLNKHWGLYSLKLLFSFLFLKKPKIYPT